jgi:hypothetical protein
MVSNRYPRFLCGRGLFAALVLGVTTVELNCSSELASCAAFVAASSFESFSSFWAAFALLLNLFFGLGTIFLS